MFNLKKEIMKRNLLILAVVALFACSLNSCDPIEKSRTELLTIEKGWVLSFAISSPAYLMSDGVTQVTDLIMGGYLNECELDDIIIFNANGGQTINPGAAICEDFGYQTEKAGTWNFSEDESVLNFQVPFFYNDEYTTFDAELENATILSLTENELRVSYSFTDESSPAKGNYTFTLTYVPVK